MSPRLVLLAFALAAALVSCGGERGVIPSVERAKERALRLPAEPPPGYGDSCAERIRPWPEVRRSPDEGSNFLCIDTPSADVSVPIGTPIPVRGWAGYPATRGWAAYPSTPDVAIQIRVVDTLGRRSLVTVTRRHEGYGGAFRLVPVEVEAPLPRDTVPGETVRIELVIADPTTGDGLASGEVTARVAS